MPSLVPATSGDALLLYTWRCRAELAPWYEGRPTGWEEHRAWFEARIRDPLVRLLIWEEDGRKLGVVRIDSNGELAYYAPNTRDIRAMLHAATAYAGEYGGRLKITLDLADDTGLEALEAAGFTVYPARSLVYSP